MLQCKVYSGFSYYYFQSKFLILHLNRNMQIRLNSFKRSLSVKMGSRDGNFISLMTLQTAVLVFSFLIASTEAQRRKQNVSDFAALNLNQESLRGSRWFLELKGIINVFHSIDIVDISKVNVDTMSLRVEFHLKQRWIASDLEFPEGLFNDTDTNDTFVSALESVLDYVWSPDSYLPNARETKISSVSTLQSIVKIRKNKTISFQSRMYSVLGCAFNFQWYPLDKQSCDLIFESYAWTSDKVKYKWEPVNPISSTDVKLHQYDLRPLQTHEGVANRFGRGETFGYVSIQFSFERQIAYHLIQIFTPTILIVVLSWFSFWLGFDAIAGRMGLLITCMLSLITMHTGLKGDLPPVNYIKMIDIWLVSCMGFVFAALLEFVIVRYLQNTQKQKEDAKKAQIEAFDKNNKPPSDADAIRAAWDDPGDKNGQINSVLSRLTTSELSAVYWRRKKKTRREQWEYIDLVCRFIFPIAFAVFLLIYWPTIIIGAQSQ